MTAAMSTFPGVFDEPTLFEVPPVVVDVDPDLDGERGSIDERFATFDELNPWVYDTLRSLALDLVDRGHARIGIGMLFEVVRWQVLRQTSDPSSSFKVNNDYRSRYARKLAANEPRLVDVFETRKLSHERTR